MEIESGKGAGVPRTVAEVDLDALRHNARAAGACLPGGAAALMAVVKANGYGLGLAPVSRALEDLVGAFGVACLDEALALRSAGVNAKIYLLGPALPQEREAVAWGGFVPPVSDPAEARAFAEAAEACGEILPVCAVLDTGMGRIGALPGAAAALLATIRDAPSLALDSVASHFPSADEDGDWTRRQEESFVREVAALRAAGHVIPLTHIANSAGLSGYVRGAGEMARAGLMLYGISPLPEKQAALRPVFTWKAKVTQVRDLPAGWGVSYGRTFLTTEPTRVATLAVGYADGYPRQLSGRGACALLGGVRCPVLGRVTMDQLMVDVSALTDPVRPGENAVLLGRQGAEEITAGELAGLAGTIPWHILTALGPRVARRYTGG